MINANYENGLCLLIEDQKAAIDFIQKQVQTAFPNLKVVATRGVRETQAWMTSRVKEKNKNPLALALVDLGLPDGSGVELIRRLRKEEPETINVVLTIHGEDSFLFEALTAGAYGYLLKDDNDKALVAMLKRLEEHEPPLSPAIARRLLTHLHGKPLQAASGDSELTPRERETLSHLASGLTVPEAAACMGLSRQTVAGYVKTIYEKLHVSNRAQATLEAIRRGLV